MNILERVESVAQNYVRRAPVAFDKARDGELFDEQGNRYIDFHAGRGALALGYNNRKVCAALVDYISDERILQSRDRTTVAKRSFVERFVNTVLQPRALNYKLLFTDPSAGIATEVALRLARRYKKRSKIVSFTNGYHGLTDGALSVTYRVPSRYELTEFQGAGVFMPYCGHLSRDFDTLEYFRQYLKDAPGNSDLPAAAIVETVQVEGGVQIASEAWLQGLERLCREFGILLIVDETQTGCGRLGRYFGFESAGLQPDIVLMPSALAGGLPLSMLLMRPELDQWRPGEEVGTLQGNNLAFVAAAELLSWWEDETFASSVAQRAKIMSEVLGAIPAKFENRTVNVRGTGMMWGIDLGRPAAAAVLSGWAFERGLLVEPAWVRNEVLLVTPPLTISENVLHTGLGILTEVVGSFLSH